MKKRSKAEKRPRCNTPATSIHRDILSHIYGFLSSLEEHRACLVCRHWSNALPRSYCLMKTGVHYATAEAVRNIKEKDFLCGDFPGSSSESLWANLKHASLEMTNQNVKSLLRWARGMETLIIRSGEELTSFGLAMAPWPATLVHLDVSYCDVTDLKFLAHLPNLKVLKLSSCDDIKHRGGFDVLKTHCRSLRVLDMGECRGLRNVEFLRGHPALTSVNVANTRINTFEPLATVATLQVLKVLGCTDFNTSVGFNCFSDHPNLRDISTDFLPSVRIFPTLRCLNSFQCCLENSGPSSNDLDALNAHPTLRDVDITFPYNPSSRQLAFLRTLPQLDKLEIRSLPDNFDFLEQHPSLRELNLSAEGFPTNLRSIGAIPRLETLKVWDLCDGDVDLAFIKNHGSLRRLEIGCCAITSKDLSALATCPKLQDLVFADCHDLENLNFLRNHKTLLSLIVSSRLLKSSHLRVLLSVPRLESLDIDLCESVDDISFLAGHPSLFDINASRTKVTAQNVPSGFRAPVTFTLDFDF